MAENTKAVKEALEHEIDYLRNRLADRLAEKDHLLFHVCRRLESDYMIQIGCHEIKNFAALGKVLRIKRGTGHGPGSSGVQRTGLSAGGGIPAEQGIRRI